LSDEVLTEISQLLESQVDVDNQDRIYDYISKKYNLPRQVDETYMLLYHSSTSLPATSIL
jgi:hypothetical protein